MATFDLRPLSLGEILDRTFNIYRSNFLLFIGIAGIPRIPVLAVNLARLFLQPRVPNGFGRSPITTGALALALGLAVVIVVFVTYLLAQGATIRAVADLYLGRAASVQQSLAFAWSELGMLIGVAMLNGLAVGGAFILLVIPGIYVLCRLLLSIPVASIERLGPRDSLSRSWDLTKDFAGRSFMIFLLYFVVLMALSFVVGIPVGIAVATRGQFQQLWVALASVGDSIINVLINPILLIATAIFYFDLRVRKEAFDLQFMMNPDAERFAGPSSGAPPILS